jgi:hypothetical protein
MDWFEIKENTIVNIIVADETFIESLEGNFILRTEENSDIQIGYIYNAETNN